MPKCKTVGYIVYDRETGPCGLTAYSKGRTVLCFGGRSVQVFDTRAQAAEAIASTCDYAREENVPWGLKFDIFRLTTGGRLLDSLVAAD